MQSNCSVIMNGNILKQSDRKNGVSLQLSGIYQKTGDRKVQLFFVLRFGFLWKR